MFLLTSGDGAWKKDGERVLESMKGTINPSEQFTAIGYSPSVTAGVEGIKSLSELGVSRSMVSLVETVIGHLDNNGLLILLLLPFSVTVAHQAHYLEEVLVQLHAGQSEHIVHDIILSISKNIRVLSIRIYYLYLLGSFMSFLFLYEHSDTPKLVNDRNFRKGSVLINLTICFYS